MTTYDPSSVLLTNRVAIVTGAGGGLGYATALMFARFGAKLAICDRVPDTLAFGASFRLRPMILLAAEVTRITYSRIRDDFVTAQAIGSGRAPSFSLDNGIEVHGGIQYLGATRRFIPRLRAGVWYDPDHSVHFTPNQSSITIDDRLFDERLATALSTGKNQVHITGGVGLTFSPHLEFNAGFDAASTSKIFSSSVIVR
jgi:long-subunit fatty acid transport protein